MVCNCCKASCASSGSRRRGIAIAALSAWTEGSVIGNLESNRRKWAALALIVGGDVSKYGLGDLDDFTLQALQFGVAFDWNRDGCGAHLDAHGMTVERLAHENRLHERK